jgi:hypothetical protein
MQFSEAGIKSVLEEIIKNCGLRQVNHTNHLKDKIFLCCMGSESIILNSW